MELEGLGFRGLGFRSQGLVTGGLVEFGGFVGFLLGGSGDLVSR